MGATTLTRKGQVTIPKPIRDRLGLKPGDRVVFREDDSGRVVVEAEILDVRGLKGMLGYDGPPVSIDQMNQAIARAAGT